MLSLVYNTIKVIISVIFIGSNSSFMKLVGNISLVKALPKNVHKSCCYTLQVCHLKTHLILDFFGIRNVGLLRVFLNQLYPLQLVQDST